MHLIRRFANKTRVAHVLAATPAPRKFPGPITHFPNSYAPVTHRSLSSGTRTPVTMINSCLNCEAPFVSEYICGKCDHVLPLNTRLNFFQLFEWFATLKIFFLLSPGSSFDKTVTYLGNSLVVLIKFQFQPFGIRHRPLCFGIKV